MIKSLIKGTFILTFTGIITKLIGFLYKIYLSNIFEPETLGIYQLIFPVFALCFTIFGAGLQTAVSQMAAANKADKCYLKDLCIKACIISVILAVLSGGAIFLFSDKIACTFIGEARCSLLLKYLAIAFIPCGIASCINGIYYGLRKTLVPAVSQLIEQIMRVGFLFVTVLLSNMNNMEFICIFAVIAISVGEIISMIYNIIMIVQLLGKNDDICKATNYPVSARLLKLAAPLTGNRLIIAVLHSVETFMIPVMLKKYGMSSGEALSVYAVLTGMAMPFIMFPATITSSLSVILLPAISELSDKPDKVKRTSSICLWTTLILGVFSTVFFMTLGKDMACFVFKNDTVGVFVEILSFLCPFIFLSTTLTSIINGLGKTNATFIITVIGLCIRISLTLKTVPFKGISGYLISILISQLFVTLISYNYYRRLLLKGRIISKKNET